MGTFGFSMIDQLIPLVEKVRRADTDVRDAVRDIVKLVRADRSLASPTLRALNDTVRGHAAVHPRATCDRCDLLMWAISECERMVAAGLPIVRDAAQEDVTSQVDVSPFRK
jgi:hypothetical protein